MTIATTMIMMMRKVAGCCTMSIVGSCELGVFSRNLGMPRPCEVNKYCTSIPEPCQANGLLKSIAAAIILEFYQSVSAYKQRWQWYSRRHACFLVANQQATTSQHLGRPCSAAYWQAPTTHTPVGLDMHIIHCYIVTGDKSNTNISPRELFWLLHHWIEA